MRTKENVGGRGRWEGRQGKDKGLKEEARETEGGIGSVDYGGLLVSYLRWEAGLSILKSGSWDTSTTKGFTVRYAALHSWNTLITCEVGTGKFSFVILVIFL